EGRDPSRSFSTHGYLSRNQDVMAAGVNPLEHFVRHGAAEGRSLAASAEHPTHLTGHAAISKINIERTRLKVHFGIKRILGPSLSNYLSSLLAALRRLALQRESRRSSTSETINENREIYLRDLFERSAAKAEKGSDYAPKALDALDGNELSVRLI